MTKFKKFFTFKRIFHFLSISTLLTSIILIFTKYKVILNRFLSSLVYLKDAFVNWVNVNMLHKASNLPEGTSSLDIINILPLNVEDIKLKFENYFKTLFNKDVFFEFCRSFFIDFLVFILYIVVIVACLVCFYTIIDCFISIPISEEQRGKKTVVTKFYNKYIEGPVKWFFSKVLLMIKEFFSKWYYKIPFIIVWLLNFNLATIVVELLAFIFAFSSTFTFDIIFTSIAKLILDITLAFLTSPPFILIIAIIVIVFLILKNTAKNRLESMLGYDKEFIRESSPSIMISGPQGAGKSKLGAFMQRLIEIIMHEDLSSILYEFQMEYVDFPFLLYEDEISELKYSGKLVGLAGVQDYINRKKEIYCSTGDKALIFNYDGPMEFNNGIRNIDLFEMMVEYGKAYYIYSDVCSLIVSSIPVRTDLYQEDIGNFPLWNHDILNRSPEEFETLSHYSKVLVYDAFRCGNFVDKNSKYAGAFEYGSVWEPEKDKERGNKITNAKYDSSSEEANPLNDLFSFGQKIRRHGSNIHHISFWRSVADLQRTNSLNLDEMDLYDHLQILKKNTERVAFPLYFLFDIIFNIFDGFYQRFMDNTRFYGTEFILPSYLMRKAFSVIFKLHIQILNKYGYSIYSLGKTDACQHDKEAQEEKLYFINCIGHADIYKSDSLNPFIAELVRLSGISLEDFPDYDTLYLEIQQMQKQGSYFGETLLNLINKRRENK